jgi:hypothetical protein
MKNMDAMMTRNSVKFALRSFFTMALVWVSAAVAPLAQADDKTAEKSADKKKVVIPFDFISKFDDGRYGEKIGDSIWTKLNKEGGFIVPESMHEVREFCKGRKIAPSPDLPLETMQKIVRDDFDAQIGIWGSVERVSGEETDVYDLVVKCVDFSAPGGPKTIYEAKARTKTVSEIPHVYEKALLDALYGREAANPAKIDAAAEERWKSGPNLLVGGDFESGENGVPKGWEKTAGQKNEPLGNLVRWTNEKESASQAGSNKIVRFAFDAAVGDNEGVMYYSDYFPLEEGAKYRFQCRFRTNGPNVKVFLKAYDDTKTEYRESDSTLPKEDGPGVRGDLPKDEKSTTKKKNVLGTSQRREVYRCQMKLDGPKNAWNTHSEDFTPQHTKYTPKWGRVMLYAYLGSGEVEFDDVIVKRIVPPPTANAPKVQKHSSATKVTLPEMQENERCGKEDKK